MTVVAGIDEAGYGPLLGPLVVAAAAFRLEDGAKEADLDKLVGDHRAQATGLPLGDSKQLYHSGGSLERIETSTLGHLALGRGLLPIRVGSLLAGAVDLRTDEVEAIPWYAGRLLGLALPRVTSIDAILTRAWAHQDLLAARGARFADLFVAPVLVPRFNRLTAAAGSKAWTLFHTTGRLIEALVAAFPDDELVIHLDRQGGRIHYGLLLQTFFPLAPLTTVRERAPESVYRLDWPGRGPVRIDFRVKADGSRAPVALASVAAKTVRELFMEALNAWFAEHVAGVAPTAGYGTDGRRFLADVERRAITSASRRTLFVRCR